MDCENTNKDISLKVQWRCYLEDGNYIVHKETFRGTNSLSVSVALELRLEPEYRRWSAAFLVIGDFLVSLTRLCLKPKYTDRCVRSLPNHRTGRSPSQRSFYIKDFYCSFLIYKAFPIHEKNSISSTEERSIHPHSWLATQPRK